MDFVAVVDQVSVLLRQRGRVAYRTLKRQFHLDDEAIEDLKLELIDSQRVALDEQGTVLVWTGEAASSPVSAVTPAPASAPLGYTPPYLAEYLPVSDLLKAYCHIEDRDDLRTVQAKITGHILTLDDALQDTVPAVLALFEALPADSPFLSLDPLQRRRRTMEALKRVLLRESQVQPLLLIFEDLHWIDTETQAVLDLLVESLPTARLLLLVNYRPEYQHGWGSKTYYTQLRLDPLPETSAEELLQALLGTAPALVPLTQILIARTQGNPFFLEESVRTLVEEGILLGERGAYHVSHPLDTLQVPATVQALLAARIDRLPSEDKRLLQTAAVIGTEVPWPLMAC